MNDEIKEILMNKEFGDGKYYQLTTELTINEWNKLLDYITNLQEEIENKNNEIDVLKDQIEWYKQQCDDLEMQIGSEEI